jgi:hypothetical protein
MEGESRKWLPHAQPAQQHNAPHESRCASSERKQHGFGEQLAQNAIAARTKSQAQGHFAGTVGGARGKQAAQVGTGRQQNQTRQQHQSGEKSPRGPVQIVAMKTRPRQRIRLITFFFGIGLFRYESTEFRSAVACAGVTPGFRCPTVSNIQWLRARSRSSPGSNCSWFTMGTKKSGSEKQDGPWNQAAPRQGW